MTVEIRLITDPACPWSWGAEPQRRRLEFEFGESIKFVYVMGGLARSYDSGYRDEDGRIGSGEGPAADLALHWLAVTAETGMPCDPRLWREAALSSTYPACMAVKAAAEQGPALEAAYLRRLREAILCERRKLDHLEALVAEAGAAGLDTERFRVDVSSNAIVEALGADLEEARAVDDAARAAGAARQTEGKERLAFPTAVFRGEGRDPGAVYGCQPYDAYREAAIAAGAEPAASARPSPLEAVERFGRLATREVEELSGLPVPVARAELWSLARDWRLRPVPVLAGGELWERA